MRLTITITEPKLIQGMFNNIEFNLAVLEKKDGDVLIDTELFKLIEKYNLKKGNKIEGDFEITELFGYKLLTIKKAYSYYDSDFICHFINS